MGLFRNSKKGAGFLIAVLVVIAFFIILSKIVDLSTRECSQDRDCASDSYCSSDFRCHKYPVITEVNYVPAALVLGLCLVIAAIILRWKK
jgi:ABC-type antimicrobial peptide transport system permease subunit